MSEIFELKTFHLVKEINNEDEIEEYHDIIESKLKTVDEDFSLKITNKLQKEFDFFTKEEVKSSHKKRKSKKKGLSLMEIINSELAAVENPIERNVITKVSYFKEQPHSYLDIAPKTWNILSRQSWPRDFDWNQRLGVQLTPVFPQALDNAPSVEVDIPSVYVEPKIEDANVAANGFNTSLRAKFLNIEIRDLKLKHHHYFSLEQLLFTQLLEVFEEYKIIVSTSSVVEKDIKINRNTKDNLRKELLKIDQKKENLRLDPTVRKYTYQMICLRQKFKELLKKRTEIINTLLSLWSDIEMIRDKNNSVECDYKLEIIKRSLKKDERDAKWMEMFNTEYSDLLDELEFEYVSKYITYKQNKYKIKMEDEKSSTKKITKPKLEIDEEELKRQTEYNINTTLKTENFEIQLKSYKNTSIVKKVKDNVIKQSKFYFSVFIDNAFVCESEFYTISEKDFNECKFYESLSVQILPENRVILLALFENENNIAVLNITLSEVKKNIFYSDFDKVEFVSKAEIPPNDQSVGSGYSIKDIATANKVRLKSSNVFKGKLYTRCETNLRIGWNENFDQNNEEAIRVYKTVEHKIKRLINGIEVNTFENIKDIIETVYEKDIGSDDYIIKAVQNLSKTKTTSCDTFEIDENDPQYTRLKLLHLRSNGEFADIEDKVVPLHASQISTSQFNCLQKHDAKKMDMNNFSADKYTEMDPIEIQRFIGVKYVESLNKNMMKNLNENLLKKSYRDVVWDLQDLRVLFTKQSDQVYNRHIRDYSQVSDKDLEINVTVLRAFNLPERSTPILVDDVVGHDDTIAGYKMKSLRPFVKVYYQGNSTQSTTAIGCHPTWNQTLRIKAKPGRQSTLHINLYDEHKTNVTDNYSEDNSYQGTMHYRCCNKWLGYVHVPLQSVFMGGKLKGTFKINTPSLLLGYESVVAAKDTSQTLIPELQQILKKDTSFIALQITTKTNNHNINYNLPLPSDSEDYLIRHLNLYLTEFQNEFPARSIFLTFIDSAGKNKCVTQFIQPILPPDYESFPKNPRRADSAISKSSNLSKSSSSKSMEAKKNLDIEKGYTGSELERDSIYSVYDRSWKGENELDKILQAVLRYVSLIPCYEIAESYVVTLMGVELLKVLYGSPRDHTILLASYFTYLGLKTYIISGLALPRGLSSYVLTKYDLKTRKMVMANEEGYGRNGFFSLSDGFFSKSDGVIWYLYDAVKGERFELRDISCPLKTVEYVFDSENIWVNVQSSQDCEGVSFDLTKSSEWQEVFNKSIFVMKQPIMSDTNLYSPPLDTEHLRNTLENRIKTKIQKWRSHSKTVWNRYVSTVIREMVPQLDLWALHPTQPRPSLGNRLKQILVTYKVYGFPLNLPYVNSKSTISTVKSTGIHVNDDPNVEFGLAVEVYGYPNNVYSVWVFLVSVARI